MLFRYPFQKIVDLKNTEKTQAEWELSQAVGDLVQEETRLTELESLKNRVQQQGNDVAQATTTISQMRLIQQYVNHIDHQIDRKHQDVQAAKHSVQKRQEQLNEKMLEEKVWSKAREKAFRRFEAEERRKEQYELDEMATVRFQKAGAIL